MSVTKVIKRNGTVEDFSQSKVNDWQFWASENVRSKVNWKSVVIDTLRKLPSIVETKVLQAELVKTCMEYSSWNYGMMAGRLYATIYRKDLYKNGMPFVKDLQQKLQGLGLMEKLSYTDLEYNQIESIIDHSKDLSTSYTQLLQLRNKYSLSNGLTKERYETPQFIYMRMAMALAENEPPLEKMRMVKRWYRYFSDNKINCPTPNYTNLGTPHNGYASCCLYTVDDTARSLAIGDHIAYTMTYMSAGIGGYLNTRSLNSPVKGGKIIHQGKMPYFESLAGAVKANMQGGRGGACTTYFSCFDVEAMTIIMAQNPRTPVDKQNRNIHFSFMYNKFFVEKVYNNEKIFAFDVASSPELAKAFIGSDYELFKKLYSKHEEENKDKLVYVSAREIAIAALRQSHEVSTLYFFQVDEVNRHTSFKEPINSSNLCSEIVQPTSAYQYMPDLYSKEDHGRGEISVCSLAGIVISLISSDDEYFEACYLALKMIDVAIYKTVYEFPHLETTAKARMNAGVGIIGLAHYLAKRGLKYNTQEGLDEIHRVSERHMYFMLKASLKLGKELGNAPWMHKTKWPDGWLPIDTYNKNVDNVTSVPLQYDWEALRSEIVANGGIRNSSLVAHMPSESSSKATGTPNSVYPIRSVSLKKTDLKQALKWVAMDSDELHDKYQLAWELSTEDLSKFYGVIQKFTDQSTSADYYKDRVKEPVLKASDLLDELYYMYMYGVKTRYYLSSKTLDVVKLNGTTEEDRGCGSGACTL